MQRLRFGQTGQTQWLSLTDSELGPNQRNSCETYWRWLGTARAARLWFRPVAHGADSLKSEQVALNDADSLNDTGLDEIDSLWNSTKFKVEIDSTWNVVKHWTWVDGSVRSTQWFDVLNDSDTDEVLVLWFILNDEDSLLNGFTYWRWFDEVETDCDSDIDAFSLRLILSWNRLWFDIEALSLIQVDADDSEIRYLI